jgi:hypothetical protein
VLHENSELLNHNTVELLRLRNEVAQLQNSLRAATTTPQSEPATSSLQGAALSWLNRVELLKRRLEQVPELKIPELQFLTSKDWLRAAETTNLKTDADFRKALKELRAAAKVHFGAMIRSALVDFARTNNGVLPSALSELQPYFKEQVEEALLSRYEMAQTGRLELQKKSTWVVEKAEPVDRTFDTKLEVRSDTVTPVNLQPAANEN